MIDEILKSLHDIRNFTYGAHEASQNEAFYKIHMKINDLMSHIERERLKEKELS